MVEKERNVLSLLPNLSDHKDNLFTSSSSPKVLFNLPTSVDTKSQRLSTSGQVQLCSYFQGDTLVTMGDLSEKQIKNIKIGDYVSNQDGMSRKVVRKYERTYTGDLYSIEIKGINDFILWLSKDQDICIKYAVPSKSNKVKTVLQENIKYIKVRYIQLTKKPFVVFPTLKTNLQHQNSTIPIIDIRNLLEENDLIHNEDNQTVRTINAQINYALPVKFELTSDLMRVLGLFLADGSYRKDDKYNLNGITFTFNRSERDLIDFVQKIMLTSFGLNIEIRKSYKRPSETVVVINNATLAYIFRKLCGECSFGKELNPLLYNLPQEHKLQLLRGWIDSNAINKIKSRYKNKSNNEIRGACQIEGVTISERLSRDLFRLALTCELKPSLSINNNAKYGKSELYTLYFCGPDILQLYSELKKELFDNGVKSGRRCCYIKDDKNFYCEIESIKKKHYENIPVYNLEVDIDNEYIANFCLIHNSTGNNVN